ncbi:MAG: tyrosine-type recombinase/integrase [Gammaproteobacteria bacterium]|jgi:site-specific recombinase XerD
MTYEIATPAAIIDNLEHLKEQTLFSHPNYNKLVFTQQDFNLVKQFLLNYVGSKATYNTYRREIERYLQWLWLVQNRSILKVKRKDVEIYLGFCANPPKNWITNNHFPRFILKDGIRQPNPVWRPFVLKNDKKRYLMSQAGWKSLFAVLGSFHQFLIEEEHAEINPIAQIRQKSRFIRKEQSRQQVRRLTELQWNYVIETAEIMANQDHQYERTLFIVSCLYGMYLRISELTATDRWIPQMNNFYQDNEGDWWFKTVGKGNKERIISVSDAMLEALKRYRKNRGLPALPSLNDISPLVAKSHGEGAITSTRHIRRIVQQCFDQAIQRMIKDNFVDEAEQLKAATVHWLRHTGISDDVKIRPREHVRDDAGHGSGAITDRYIDIELRRRHATAKKKTIKPDD